eukprot:4409775-Pyramimonas_sp.AAC.1
MAPLGSTAGHGAHEPLAEPRARGAVSEDDGLDSRSRHLARGQNVCTPTAGGVDVKESSGGR